jgi:hypothetical protein
MKNLFKKVITVLVFSILIFGTCSTVALAQFGGNDYEQSGPEDAPTSGINMNGSGGDIPLNGSGSTDDTNTNPTGTGGGSGSGQFENPLSGKFVTIPGFVNFVLYTIVLPLGFIVVVFYIILSGYKFVTAQGNPKLIEEAKNNFFAVLIGAAVLLGSVAIASAVNGTLCQVLGNVPGICSSGTVLNNPQLK